MSMFGRDSGSGEKRGRGRPKKDPFEKVSDAFKQRVQAAESVEAVNAIVADVAKMQEANAAAMQSDPEVIQLREALKLELADYKETMKRCKQELAFCVEHLKIKGA